MRLRKTDEASDLTPQQEDAIPVLLSSSSIPKAAEATGVSKATLWRWLRDETFAEAYRQARRDAVGQAVARLQHTSSDAAEALHDVAMNPLSPAAARVSAARAMLEMAFNGLEIEDHTERLERLERGMQS